MSVLAGLKALLLGGGDYLIQRSVRLRSSASAYLNRTPASATNRKTWTWSGWVKRGVFGSAQALFEAGNGTGTYTMIWFSSSDQIQLLQDNGAGGVLTITSNAVFRDPAAWYHVVIAVDTTQATSNNRTIFYVNGVNQSLTYTLQLAQNADTWVDYTYQHRIGGRTANTSYFDGYLTEVNFIDGQALTPSSFGENDAVTGVWKPKKYAGTYGTNGFYLNFSDNSAATAAAIGKDSSGNGNNWTPNNISVTAGVTYDSMTDVPTLTSATTSNFAVLNPLGNYGLGTVSTLSNGNLTATSSGNSWWISTIGMPSTGKFYCEYTPASVTNVPWIGIYATNSAYGIYRSDGTIAINGSNVATVATYAANDVIAVSYDSGTGAITFYKNNTSVYTGTIAYDSPMFFAGFVSTGNTVSVNFGQRPFTYTPPTGFKSLNTFNLPDSAIPKGNKQFDVSTWTGTGVAQNIVNSGGFQPDLVWVKARSFAYSHRLANAITGATNYLDTAQTVAEFTDAGNSISSFNSNGFGVGTYVSANNNTTTYVGWQWKASNAAAVTNTSGSISSQVSANPTAGFSVVTYTGNGTAGATAGHGLGVTPAMVIYKARVAPTSVSGNWIVWHKAISQAIQTSSTIQFNTFTGATYLNATNASSTYGFDNQINENTKTYVAYCFAEVAGYSKFGSYTGNGSADGPFIYTGFRVRWLLIKSTSMAGTRWELFDTARSLVNPSNERLSPNESTAEVSGYNSPDFLSNGFKLRGASGYTNDTSVTYIYAAFAENPFKNALAR